MKKMRFQLRRGACISVLATVLLSALLTAPFAVAQIGPHVAVDDHPYMTFGPVPGFTTAAHRAPKQLLAPRGSLVTFAVEGPGVDTVEWSGGKISGVQGREARFAFEENGVYELRALCLPENETLICRVLVADVSPSDLAFAFEIKEQAPLQSKALEDGAAARLHRYFEPGSIGGLYRDGAGEYVASVGRRIDLSSRALFTSLPERVDRVAKRRARVPLAALKSLLEWRVDGAPIGAGEAAFAASEPGRYQVSVGPYGFEQSFELTAYGVEIASAYAAEALPMDAPIAFRAKTTPAGYEHLVTWSAAAKNGVVVSAEGSGASFTATFAAAPVQNGEPPLFGVRADSQRWGSLGEARISADPLDPDEVPEDYYDRVFLDKGEPFVLGAEGSHLGPVENMRFLTMVNPDSPARPFEDYRAMIFPNGEAMAVFDVSGHFFVDVQGFFGSQTFSVFVAAAPSGDEKKKDGRGKVIPDPKGDIIIVEDPPAGDDNGFDENAANDLDGEVRVKDVDDAIKAICDAFDAKGGKVCVVLIGHGSSGNMSVGDGQKRDDNKRLGLDKDGNLTPKTKEFIKKLKGKIKSLTLFGCSVGEGADGCKLMEGLAGGLGATVCGYDKNVCWGARPTLTCGAKKVEKPKK